MKFLSDIAIILPVYEASYELRKLVIKLLSNNFSKILIIDDGSILKTAEAAINNLPKNDIVLIKHDKNKGKGAALKTAFNYCLLNYQNLQGVITMDADGQHLIEDLLVIKKWALISKEKVIIGSRNFESKNVPLRSKIGNLLTRFIFKITTGTYLKDTQSGLRYIPKKYLDDLTKVKGDRYDFELSALTKLISLNAQIKECDISTTYIDKNSSSHFNPLIDSTRIYFVFFRYCSISILSALLDLLIFGIFYFFNSSVFIATFLARICSALFNFTANRNFTFYAAKGINTLKNQILLYTTVGLLSATLSASILSLLVDFNIVNTLILKAFVDTSIFIINFIIQRFIIFKTLKNLN